MEFNNDKNTIDFNKEPLIENVTIQNIVASVSLHTSIPLEKVSNVIKRTEYDPEQFPGLVFRLREPKITALLFSSGNVVCTGAKSKEDIELAVERMVEELKVVDVKVTEKPDIKIQNVVASGDIHMKLNLNQLVMNLKYAEYEPEQFPGLVFKLPHTRITFLLFGTGKIVCTGGVTIKEINEGVIQLMQIVKDIQEK